MVVSLSFVYLINSNFTVRISFLSSPSVTNFKTFNPDEATGPDNIRLMVIKELASQIAPILTIIFNISIETSKVPDDWRTATVTPAYYRVKSTSQQLTD